MKTDPRMMVSDRQIAGNIRWQDRKLKNIKLHHAMDRMYDGGIIGPKQIRRSFARMVLDGRMTINLLASKLS